MGGIEIPGDLDREVLADLRRDIGDDIVQRVLGVFLRQGGERVAAVAEALAGGDLAGCAASAHGMRSSSGSVGALRVSECAKALEAACLAGDRRDAERWAAELDASWGRMKGLVLDYRRLLEDATPSGGPTEG